MELHAAIVKSAQSGTRRLRNRRRSLALLCLAIGAAATLWLVLRVGAASVGDGLRAVGWAGVLAVSAFHLIATTSMGLAWWNLRRSGKPQLYVWGRLLRDAGSELLPLSQIGGYALAVRAPIMAGAPATAAVASVLVDATLEFLAEIAFVALGTVLALRLSNAAALIGPALLWMLLASVAAALFMLLQAREHDLLNVVARRFERGWFGPVLARALLAQAQLRQIYRRKRRIFQSLGLHLSAWLVAGAEAWLILRLIGAQIDLRHVLVLESLLYAARSLGFLVPGAIGVQEGAYLLLGGMLGIPGHVVLALSLVKRARDLVLGSAALASWQVLEGRRLTRAKPHQGGEQGQA